MKNVFAKLAEQAGSHRVAASLLNQRLGSDYSYKVYWGWAHDKRPAPARVCNAVLELLDSPDRVPQYGNWTIEQLDS